MSLEYEPSFTPVTGPRRSSRLELSCARAYEPQLETSSVTPTHFCELVFCPSGKSQPLKTGSVLLLVPRRALRGSILKVNFEQILSTFGNTCPQNGSKKEPRAPRTSLGYPNEAPSVGIGDTTVRLAEQNGRGRKISHPAHYTLHPTPCTLHPTPYTLHPTPYTLHPTPYTLHSTPYSGGEAGVFAGPGGRPLWQISTS